MAADSKVRAFFFPPTYQKPATGARVPAPVTASNVPAPTPPQPPIFNQLNSTDKGKRLAGSSQAPTDGGLTSPRDGGFVSTRDGGLVSTRDVLDRRKGLELGLDRAGLGVRDLLLEAGRKLEGVCLEGLAKLLRSAMEGDKLLVASSVEVAEVLKGAVPLRHLTGSPIDGDPLEVR